MGADISIKQAGKIYENTLEFNKIKDKPGEVYMHARNISHPGIHLPDTFGGEENLSHYKGDIVIPGQVVDNKGKAYKVTALGEPNKPVMRQATNLSSVTIPGTVKTIYPFSFGGCIRLSVVNLKEGTEVIEPNAFFYCGIFLIFIPDSVHCIDGAFYLNEQMEEVTIGRGMRSMKGAFEMCPCIRRVVCKATTPPVIDDKTFAERVYNFGELFVPYESLQAYKNHNLWGKFSKINEIADTVPQDVQIYRDTHRVQDGVNYFLNFAENQAWVVPLESSESYTQKEIVIADKVVMNVSRIDNGAFKDAAVRRITLPNGLKSIGRYAFYGASLESISLPSSLKKIEEEAFLGCPLKEIDIPGGVSEIGSSAFEGCNKMARVTLHDGLRKISACAFNDNYALREVTIPSTVTEIGTYAFSNADLKIITCMALTPPKIVDNNAFDEDVMKNAVLKVPTSALAAYQADPVWGKFLHIVSEGSSANSNLGDTFVFDYIRYKVTSDNPKEVTVIKVVENYKDMLEHRAHDCGVVNIMIPNKVKYKGEDYTVTDISDEASGEKAYGIGVLEIPRGVKRIGKKAFYDSVNMKGLILHDGLKVIEESAFEHSTRSPSYELKLPNTLLEIGRKAFSQCGAIGGELKIPDSVISIGREAFEHTSITSVTFGKGIERIEPYTFYNSDLKELFLPEWIKHIGAGAFEVSVGDGTGGLKKVTCMATTPPAMDPVAFAEAYQNAELFVPSSALQAYKDDVAWQQFAKITGIDDGLTPPPLKPVCTGDYINVNGLRYYVRDAEHRVVYVTKLDHGFIYWKEQIVIPATIEYHGVTYWVKKVDKEAFKGSKTLYRITLPYTIDEIMEDAFTDCRITSVTCYAATPPLVAKDAILPDKDKRKYAILSVPKTSVELYEADKNWKGYDHITAENFTAPPAPEGLPEPPQLLDPGNNFVVNGLRYWYKGDDVVYFADAPKGCSYAGKMLVPLTVEYNGVTYRVTKVGNYAFKNATNVTTVCLNSEIEEIKTEAFVGCTGLTKLVCFAKTPPVLAKDAIPKEVAQHLEIKVVSTYRGEYLMAGWGKLGAKLTFDSPQKLLDEWNN